MSNDAPIGVFDSGVGGLSVLQAIRQTLPLEHLIYIADSGHAPYGDKSAAYISSRARKLTEHLLNGGVKAIVIACNTASVIAAQELRSWCPAPIIAMEPAIKPATLQSRSRVIGVLATDQTVRSASVARLSKVYGQDVQILLQACPGLAEQVERAALDSEETLQMLNDYVKPLVMQGADTLVLGCTHYAFLRASIQALAGTDVAVIDPAPAIAKELRRRLEQRSLLRGSQPQHASTQGRIELYTNAELARAKIIMQILWASQGTLNVQALDSLI